MIVILDDITCSRITFSTVDQNINIEQYSNIRQPRRKITKDDLKELREFYTNRFGSVGTLMIGYFLFA